MWEFNRTVQKPELGDPSVLVVFWALIILNTPHKFVSFTASACKGHPAAQEWLMNKSTSPGLVEEFRVL